MRRLTLLLMATVVLLLTNSTFCLANDNPSKDDCYSIDIPYGFTITPKDDKWADLETREEMIEACSIPSEIYSKMTTEALLVTFLNHPLILDYLAYTTPDEAYNMMIDSFSGFSELISREDIYDVLYQYYNAPCTIQENNSPEAFFYQTTLEYFFVCCEYKQGINLSNNLSFIELLEKNNKKRLESGEYSENTCLYLRVHPETASLLSINISYYDQPYGTVYTPNGTNVPVRSPYRSLTASEKSYLNNKYATAYPLATRIGAPTASVNCHSFAWYQISYSNGYWMPNPIYYINDNSYVSFSGSPYYGIRVLYRDSSGYISHSAVCTGSYSAGAYVVDSKWGMAGTYEHMYSYGPYGSSVTLYKAN